MNIENRNYRMLDTITIPFKCAPISSSIIILQALLSGLVPTLQIIVTAYFIDTAIEIVQNQSAITLIYPPLFAVVALIAFNWTSKEMIRFAQIQLETKMREKLRTAVVEKRAELAYKHIENHESWDIVSRVSQNTENKMKSAFNDLLSLSSMVIRVGGVFVLLVNHVWWAALMILVVSTPLFAIAVKSGKATYQANREVSKYKRRNQYLSEVLRGRNAVGERALFGFGKSVNRKWFEQYETARKIEFKTDAKWFVKMKSGSVISSLISILVIFILIHPVMSGELSIGMFISLVNGVFSIVGMMSWQLTNTAEGLAKHREFLIDLSDFAALEASDSVKHSPASQVPAFESLEFRNVRFSYPGTKQQILKGMTFRINAGKHYAFVGINGAGKTTITKLITGLYDNFEGEIVLNKRPISDYTQSVLKGFFAVVYQDFAKYEISMKDNIAVGDIEHIHNENIRERIDQVTSQLGLQSVAANLQQGIDTPLGKIKADGQDVSGGEWQRIAMARALISPAPIYILDEPTAALDPLSESKLYEEFEQISKDKTTLFISHRLGSTKLADVIFVIGDGRVLEQGSHESLMQQRGIYAEMYEKQRSWYE
jgi:ATP-binding cassette subfamily B protein